MATAPAQADQSLPTPTPALIFDDGRGILAPMTDLRPAFDIRTGGLTTLQRLRHTLNLHITALQVAPHLADLTAETHDVGVNTPSAEPILMLSGRCPLPPREVMRLAPGEALIEPETEDLIAAVGPPDDLARLIAGDHPNNRTAYRVSTADQRLLLSRVWHVRASRDACIEADLAHMMRGSRQDPPPGVTVMGDHAIHIHPTAHVCPNVVLDAEAGPIAIDAGATIRPGSIIIGPTIIGTDSTVLDQSLIKGSTAIGPVCKVAGEVGGTIFQGHANKAHAGHLGDSWVGAWANLGAGTTNSNLLNTYGDISCVPTPHAPRERTGERYLGAIIGDHVKTAINSTIMTGSIIHTGAMLAQTAAISGCVRPFAWGTDAGRHLYKLGRFMSVCETVMGRRSIEPGKAYVERVESLHAEAVADYWQDA